MDGDAKAGTYREGFVEGASALLNAIGDALPDEQRRVLDRWLEGPLKDWRHSDADERQPPLPMIDGA